MFPRKSLRRFSGTLPKLQLKRSILEHEIPTGGVWKDYQLSIIHRSFPNSSPKSTVKANPRIHFGRSYGNALAPVAPLQTRLY